MGHVRWVEVLLVHKLTLRPSLIQSGTSEGCSRHRLRPFKVLEPGGYKSHPRAGYGHLRR